MSAALQTTETQKYLTVLADVEIPDSADDRASEPEYGLYGHGEVTAHFIVTFRLRPCHGRDNEGKFYPEWQNEPDVDFKEAITFWQDRDGGDHEREIEITEEQYEAAVKEAIKFAKKAVRAVRFEER